MQLNQAEQEARYSKRDEAHYLLNFKTLFGHESSLPLLEARARNAAINRTYQQAHFDRRLTRFVNHCLYQNDRHQLAASIVNRGWDMSPLKALQKAHGNVLIALFHFGAHRDLVIDLVSQGEKLVAPIAGNAYQQFYQAFQHAPEQVSRLITLLEVEDSNVGRQVLSALREHAIGAIYADGNMGPEASEDNDGTAKVNLLGHSIHVKSGIARLAWMLKRPIIPLFSVAEDGNAYAAQWGEPLLPPLCQNSSDRKAQRARWINDTMGTLYKQLSDMIRRRPEHWEYAFCMHRWLAKTQQPHHTGTKATTHPVVESLRDSQCLLPNYQYVTALGTHENMVWVNSATRKGIQAPDALPELLNMLCSPSGVSVRHLREYAEAKGAVSVLRQALNHMLHNEFLVLDSASRAV